MKESKRSQYKSGQHKPRTMRQKNFDNMMNKEWKYGRRSERRKERKKQPPEKTVVAKENLEENYRTQWKICEINFIPNSPDCFCNCNKMEGGGVVVFLPVCRVNLLLNFTENSKGKKKMLGWLFSLFLSCSRLKIHLQSFSFYITPITNLSFKIILFNTISTHPVDS